MSFYPAPSGGGGGGISSINSDSTAAQTITLGSSGSDFNISNPGGGSHVINLPTASATNRGALSSTDWSKFNFATIGGSVSLGQVAFGSTIANTISGTNNFKFNGSNSLSIGGVENYSGYYSGATILSIFGSSTNRDYGAGTLELGRSEQATPLDGSTQGNVIFTVAGNDVGKREGVVLQGRQVGTTSGNAGEKLLVYTRSDNGNLFYCAEFGSDQSFRTYGRLLGKQGSNVSSANTVTLANDGTSFLITGMTEIDAITSTGWTDGSIVYLIFDGALTVKHNTAGAAGSLPIFLSGSADLTTTTNSTLTLLKQSDKWNELSRKIS